MELGAGQRRFFIIIYHLIVIAQCVFLQCSVILMLCQYRNFSNSLKDLPNHMHYVTLRVLAGASTQGLLLFHQVLQQHVLPPIQRPEEPEQPELWQSFCDGYEVSRHECDEDLGD